MALWRCQETGTEWDSGTDDSAQVFCDKCSAAGCPKKEAAPDARLVTVLDADTLNALVTGKAIPAGQVAGGSVDQGSGGLEPAVEAPGPRAPVVRKEAPEPAGL